MSEDVSESKPPEHNAFMRWKHTAVGRIIWAALDFVIVYIFASLAINSGQLWQWGVAVVFAIDGVYELVRFVGKLTHGSDKD